MRRIRWIATAAVPSALLIAIGQHVATDVASAPLLWTLPLALYLGTFILAFGSHGELVWRMSARWATTAIACLILSLLMPAFLALSIAASLATIFFGALAAHSALAQDRPPAGSLTDFYLSMSLGGVFGGAATALAAPILFDNLYELALAAGACLLFGVQGKGSRLPAFALAALALVLGLVAVATGLDLRIFAGAAFAVAVLQSRAIPRLAAALATVGILLVQFDSGSVAVIDRERSFFGVLKAERVEDAGGPAKVLMHGTTIHGAQRLDPAHAMTPLTYYADVTPLAEAMRRATAQAPAIDVGIVGLGAGALACQARPTDQMRIYEIDPIVARWASGEPFDYLRRCAPEARIILGDGRLQLAGEKGAPFDILFIDAFSSDPIPTHLMTTEAVQLYFDRLKADGVLVLHISNRHLDLAPEAAAIARDLGLSVRTRAAGDGSVLAAPRTTAVVLARSDAVFAKQGYGAGWTVPVAANGRAWSDDYVNLPRPLLRRH
jgi:hypothetical protein